MKNQPRNTFDKFLKISNHIHNGKYNYDQFVFNSNSVKGKIICPLHGMFEQSAKDHMSGKGCKQCSIEYTSRLKIKTYDDFLEKANSIHNNMYKYDENTYKQRRDKITIECPFHGLFVQKACNHLQGAGCRKCNLIGLYNESYFGNNISVQSKRRRLRKSFLYLIQIDTVSESYFKIGLTTNKRKFPKFCKITEIFKISGFLYDMFLLEQQILKIVENYKPTQHLRGSTECFLANDDMIDDIKTIMMLNKVKA